MPKKWATGSVKGMRVRGEYELQMNWKDGKLVKATLRGVSNESEKIKVRYGKETVIRTLARDGSLTLEASDF